MPVCPKCRLEFEEGAEWCAACDVVLLDVVSGTKAPESLDRPAARRRSGRGGSEAREAGRRQRARAESPPRVSSEEKLVLLLEEPLPEMAEMICEFLQNCGIRSIVHSESIGLLYRLPAPGAPISRSRLYVLESDYQEARELVAHFFDRR